MTHRPDKETSILKLLFEVSDNGDYAQ